MFYAFHQVNISRAQVIQLIFLFRRIVCYSNQMHPFNRFQEPYEQFSTRTNNQIMSQSMFTQKILHNTPSPYKQQGRNNTQSPFKNQRPNNISSPLVPSKFVIHHCNIIRKKAAVISDSELTHLLNELMNEFENFHDHTTKITNFREIIDALSRIPRSTLPLIGQHKFFTLLHLPFIQILQQWDNGTPLTEDESVMFKNMIKLSKPLLSEITDPNLYPPWLSDPVLLDAIAACFTDILKFTRFFDKTSEREPKSFLYLLEAYDDYQKDLNNDKTANPDKLVQLLPPIIKCLTSQFYIDSFNSIESSKGSMSKKDKFFLIKCPTFLTNYNGIFLNFML